MSVTAVDLPEVDPCRNDKKSGCRIFGFNATTFAKEYGDKGTIKQGLNYKPSLFFD